MADQKALDVYAKLRATIDNIGWKYEFDESNLDVFFRLNGEDVPMTFIMVVDEKLEGIRLLSRIPFEFSEEKRVEGAIATCAASFGLIDGNFDYDIATGKIAFRMTTSYKDCEISEELIRFMVDFSAHIVERYNDLFLALNKGYITIEQFLEKA